MNRVAHGGEGGRYYVEAPDTLCVSIDPSCIRYANTMDGIVEKLAPSRFRH